MFLALFLLQALISGSNAYHDDRVCGPTQRNVSEKQESIEIYVPRKPEPIFECYWALKTNPGKRIKFTVNRLDIEPQYVPFGKHEGLVIHEILGKMMTTESVLITNVPEGSPQTYFSAASRMFPQIHVLQNHTSCRLMATYEAVNAISPGQHDENICGSQLINAAKANPSWTVEMKNKSAYNKQCLWRFTADSGKRVRVTIKRITFIGNSMCTENKLKFFDGSDESAKPLKTICQISQPVVVTSSRNVMLLQFSAWEVSLGQGFQGEYEQVSGSHSPKTVCSGAWIAALLLARWGIHY